MVISDLAVLAYARGFTHWLYKGPEKTLWLATATAPGFFSKAAGMFETGDLITIRAANGTAIRTIVVTPESLDDRGTHIPAHVELVKVR